MPSDSTTKEQSSDALKNPIPVLFTPGPLMTSKTVKEAMQLDYASRDKKFMDAVKFVREKVLQIAEVPVPEWACILQPGSGTMGIEAAIGTLTPRPLSSSAAGETATFVLLNTGKYAERQAAIARRKGLHLVEMKVGEGKDISIAALGEFLSSLKQKEQHVAALGYVHHETSTGMVYPGEAICTVTKAIFPDAIVIADCMSSFGGMPFSVTKSCDCFITSPNKCFHSLPGFAIIVARRALVEKGKNCALNDTMDLQLQLKSFDASGQFRVTPPTTVVMALAQALKEFEQDGGIQGRKIQYARKFAIVLREAVKMGFTPFLHGVEPSSVGHIVVCVNMPTDPRWSFKQFYTFLNDRGYVIYPGSASRAKTFRFGIIGHTSVEDVTRLMACSKAALQDMGIERLSRASKL